MYTFRDQTCTYKAIDSKDLSAEIEGHCYMAFGSVLYVAVQYTLPIYHLSLTLQQNFVIISVSVVSPFIPCSVSAIGLLDAS